MDLGHFYQLTTKGEEGNKLKEEAEQQGWGG